MDRNSDSRTHRDSRKRSRSPRGDGESPRDVKRHHHRHSHRDRPSKANLPFQSRHLHKHDFESYKALFAEYLHLQKDLDINRLDRDEVKGRWKSFLGKWNRGDLAEGWYDPETKRKAGDRPTDERYPWKSEERRVKRDHGVAEQSSEEGEEDDGYGPSLPNAATAKSGPTVPNFQDLQYKREQADEDRQTRITDLRYERKQDRQTQKERLEELAPRADPSSRERQLEKKRDTAASNKAFAESKETGAEEVGDGELLGDDGAEGYKARVKAMEKQKNEREVRKEEALRARAAEREERLAVQRRKEEKTMEMLKGLARERFGGEG